MSDPLEGLATAEVNGTELAYREVGEGGPVVFIHGSLSDIRTWERTVEALGGDHRAITYSRRYSPPNAPIAPEADDPMGPHVDDLLALLSALDAEPAHLVGDSWGAFVALLAAIRAPEAVRSLVLEEPPAITLFVKHQPPRPRELIELLASRPGDAVAFLRFGIGTFAPAERAFRHGKDEEGMRRFATGVLGASVFEAMPAERLQQARENTDTLRAQLLGEGFPPLAEEELRSLRVPTLLLRGEGSPPLFRRIAGRIDELLPDSELAEVSGVTHSMHDQEPEAVGAAIAAFLARVGVPAA